MLWVDRFARKDEVFEMGRLLRLKNTECVRFDAASVVVRWENDGRNRTSAWPQLSKRSSVAQTKRQERLSAASNQGFGTHKELHGSCLLPWLHPRTLMTAKCRGNLEIVGVSC